ncbi:MAG: hypothetical protein JNM25_18065 [Planctomycetes bacterium]|nr:hypothetical protein [Planctomycetota bacterium]
MAVAERRAGRRSNRGSWLAAAGLGGALTVAALPAQALPTVQATFASGAQRAAVPGIDWFCARHLARRGEWPRGRDPSLPFAVRLGPDGITVLGDGVALPPGVVAAGACDVAGKQWLWSCRSDGTEDWFVPPDATLPAPWRAVLRELQADVLDEPRSLDAAVVIGHLAGTLVEGDPRAELLQLGASSCGEVTWTAWSTPTHLRVRGRSDGGLLLPAALLLVALADPVGKTSPLALRAFAARDGDRAEAARQCVRAPGPKTVRALSALLQAEDQVAFAAVDALRRLGATEALPQIVAAARPEAPWTSLAAADTLRALWASAPTATRQATRAAVARSDSVPVRSVDLDALVPGNVSPRPAERAADAAAARVRTIVVLALLAIGLYGLWSRERARLRADLT